MLTEIYFKKKKKLVFLLSIFLTATIAISTMSSLSAASSDNIVKPVKQSNLKDGVRFTVPSNFAKPVSYGDYFYKDYTLKLYDGKINVEVVKTDSYLSTWFIGNYSKPVTKVVLHLENRSFRDNGNEKLNSFTYTFFPKTTKNKKEYKIFEHENINPNASSIRIYYRSGTVSSGPGYSSYANLLALDLYFTKKSETSSSSTNNKADITISKIAKKGNTHTVFIKNFGKKSVGKSALGVYDGKKLIKKVNVQAIAKGKTVQVKVTLDKKYKNKIKTFKADATNKIKETNKKNNIKKIK